MSKSFALSKLFFSAILSTWEKSRSKAAWTASERWICFRFQMLKPIKAAAGSTIASSSVRSVLVRSVSRNFLDILEPRQIFLALTRKRL